MIEFIQFQNYIYEQTKFLFEINMNNGNNLDINDDVILEMQEKLLEKRFHILLPHTIPWSNAFDLEQEIEVSSLSMLIERCKKIACKIYRKYVVIGADYEINVQSRTRKDMMDRLHSEQTFLNNDHVDILVLFYLFEQCFNEMIVLLGGALSRFRPTPTYKKFKLTYF